MRFVFFERRRSRTLSKGPRRSRDELVSTEATSQPQINRPSYRARSRAVGDFTSARSKHKTYIIVVDSVNVTVIVGGNSPQSATNAVEDVGEVRALARFAVPALVHEKRTKKKLFSCIKALFNKHAAVTGRRLLTMTSLQMLAHLVHGHPRVRSSA